MCERLFLTILGAKMQTYSLSRAVPVVLATVVTGNILKGTMSPLEELFKRKNVGCLRAKKKKKCLYISVPL